MAWISWCLSCLEFSHFYFFFNLWVYFFYQVYVFSAMISSNTISFPLIYFLLELYIYLFFPQRYLRFFSLSFFFCLLWDLSSDFTIFFPFIISISLLSFSIIFLSVIYSTFQFYNFYLIFVINSISLVRFIFFTVFCNCGWWIFIMTNLKSFSVILTSDSSWKCPMLVFNSN